MFQSKEVSFVPVGRIIRTGGFKAVRAYYESLGEDFVKALDDMLLFDAVIFNVDRHYGNFGFLVDNTTNRIIAPAPLFDHGNSLLNFAGRDNLSSTDELKKYADTRKPCVYDDFVTEAASILTHERRNSLRKLLNFRFKRHSRYNLDKKRLTMLEEIVRSRASEILNASV